MVSVWLPAFSPFRTMFSKTYIPGVMQSRDCSIDKDKFHSLRLYKAKFWTTPDRELVHTKKSD